MPLFASAIPSAGALCPLQVAAPSVLRKAPVRQNPEERTGCAFSVAATHLVVPQDEEEALVKGRQVVGNDHPIVISIKGPISGAAGEGTVLVKAIPATGEEGGGREAGRQGGRERGSDQQVPFDVAC